MTRNMFDSKKKVLLVVLAVLFFCAQGFSLVIVNSSESSFQEDSSAVKDLVIEGAGYFLQSHSELLLFANKIELAEIQGADYSELQQIIAAAITNMESAVNRYQLLTQTADSAAYDQGMIDTLLAFDYASFRDARALNSVIFADVEAFLSSGDVRGVYHRLLSDTQGILVILQRLKALVDTGVFPEISDLWQANRAYSQTLLFGQFTAEIFCSLVGK